MATNFCKKNTVKSTSQNFVTFPEYMNFTAYYCFERMYEFSIPKIFSYVSVHLMKNIYI